MPPGPLRAAPRGGSAGAGRLCSGAFLIRDDEAVAIADPNKAFVPPPGWAPPGRRTAGRTGRRSRRSGTGAAAPDDADHGATATVIMAPPSVPEPVVAPVPRRDANKDLRAAARRTRRTNKPRWHRRHHRRRQSSTTPSRRRLPRAAPRPTRGGRTDRSTARLDAAGAADASAAEL